CEIKISVRHRLVDSQLNSEATSICGLDAFTKPEVTQPLRQSVSKTGQCGSVVERRINDALICPRMDDGRCELALWTNVPVPRILCLVIKRTRTLTEGSEMADRPL